MTFVGIQKFTLLDYPSKIACTVFSPGCNFRCPFCHNSEVVDLNRNQGAISEEEVLNFLKTRQGLIEGVCFTGGEPTLQSGLEDFIKKVKDLGFLIKLDTNGEKPETLKKLLNEDLLDYVAMDVKNSLKSYGKTIGIQNFSTKNIEKSIRILLNSDIDYEFRTTVVKEFHAKEDFMDIMPLLNGAKLWRLQEFRLSDTCFNKNLHSIKSDELKTMINGNLGIKTIQLY